jgi:hypothetical protein
MKTPGACEVQRQQRGMAATIGSPSRRGQGGNSDEGKGYRGTKEETSGGTGGDTSQSDLGTFFLSFFLPY